MARKFPSCSGEKIPMVRLALEKKSCLRRVGPSMRSSKDVAGFVNLHYGCRPQEHFLSLFLSSASEIIGVQEISMGSLASTEVDPRVVFAGALASGAPSIIICHNHPSGSIEPSQADVHLTQQLVNGGRLLAIKVLDHVIVGRGGGHFSFAENDRMPK